MQLDANSIHYAKAIKHCCRIPLETLPTISAADCSSISLKLAERVGYESLTGAFLQQLGTLSRSDFLESP